MKLWPLVVGPLIVVVARFAWLNGQRLLGRTRAGFSWLAARVGIAADVRLTSVLADDPTVLIAFRPAGTTHHGGRDVLRPGDEQLLLFPDSDDGATVARLRQWERTGATIVMWQDRIAGYVEFSQLRSGQQVRLAVISNAVTS